MCQELELNKNGTFKWYDLLHLRGLNVSTGKWNMIEDTVFLNSKPYKLQSKYIAGSRSDSNYIVLKDVSGAVPFANFQIDQLQFTFDIEGELMAPKMDCDSIYISYKEHFQVPVLIDSNNLKNADTLFLYVESDIHSSIFHFQSQPFILKNDTLYYMNSGGNNIIYARTKHRYLKPEE